MQRVWEVFSTQRGALRVLQGQARTVVFRGLIDRSLKRVCCAFHGFTPVEAVLGPLGAWFVAQIGVSWCHCTL